MSKKVTSLWVINVFLFTVLISLFFIEKRFVRDINLSRTISIKEERLIAKNTQPKSAPVVYDIKKIKSTIVGQKKQQAFVDLNDMYIRSSEQDAGENIVEVWNNASPEYKSNFIEVLNGRIKKAKNVLKQDPSDKRAKKVIILSESLKRMMQDNFNYSFQVPSSQEEE